MAKTWPNIRAMLDANILIAGSVWPRWPYEVLQHAMNGDFQLVLSPYIIAQAQAQITKSFPDGAWRFQQLIERSNLELVKNPTKQQIEKAAGLVRDVTDIPVALAAINAKVDYLVSEDKHLTAKDKTTEQLREKLTVLLSGTFLREVMDWTSQRLERIRHRTWKDQIPKQS